MVYRQLNEKKKEPVFFVLVAAFMLFSIITRAQEVTNIEVRKHKDTARIVYPYVLPLMGQKMTDKNIILPLPVGVMVNYLQGVQSVVVSDLKIGFNNQPPEDFGFVKFGDVKAKVQSVVCRTDVYVLPFWNVYAIIGPTWTNIKVPVTSPVSFTSDVSSNGVTYGFGTTLSAGVNGFFLALDGNVTWTKVDIVDKSVRAMVFAPRLGKVFNLKNNERNIAIWVGTLGLFYNSTTVGSLALSDALPPLPDSVINGIIDETTEWYRGLTKPQQKVVKEIAEKIRDKAQGLDIKEATVEYSLNKQPLYAFNILAGVQFQLTPHWVFRTEGSFFSQRSSLLLSVNYRFGF